MIQLMKNIILQRNCPLNLYFRCELSIQSVMRIKSIVKDDRLLDSKLQIQFLDVKKEQDLYGAISELDHKKNPILYKYISLLLNDQP